MRAIPSHVPAELVYEFDYTTATDKQVDPHGTLMQLDAKGVPEIFYSPLLGGYWVARRYRHCWELYRDTENFGSHPSFIPKSQSWSAPLIPVEVDPPVHTRARRTIGPLFTPAAINKLEADLRASAAALIDEIARGTETDFVDSFSRRWVPENFMRLFGMPLEARAEFLQHAHVVLEGATADAARQQQAGKRINEILAEVYQQKARCPADDWATMLLNAKSADGSQAMSMDELVNMGFLLYVAGLDTVSSALGWMWLYLARHPEACDKLRTDHSAIPLAIEEILRMYPVGGNVRVARHDLDFHGVKMKKGEQVFLMVTVANRDPEKFVDPQKMDLAREDNLHLSFGAGLHRCAGSNLARIELRIAAEEWLARIPRFRIKDGVEVRSQGGVGMSVPSLPLVWEKP